MPVRHGTNSPGEATVIGRPETVRTPVGGQGMGAWPGGEPGGTHSVPGAQGVLLPGQVGVAGHRTGGAPGTGPGGHGVLATQGVVDPGRTSRLR